MLIAVFLCTDIGYALRVPVGSEEVKTRINKIEEEFDTISLFTSRSGKKYLKLLIEQHKKHLKDTLDKQTKAIVRSFKSTLGPLKDGNVTVERVEELLQAGNSDIYRSINAYRETKIKETILDSNIRTYLFLMESNSPGYGLCRPLSFCINSALYDIGIFGTSRSVRINGKIVHIYPAIIIEEAGEDGYIAVDAAFPESSTDKQLHIKVGLEKNYKKEVQIAAEETFSFKNRKRFMAKRKNFKNELKEIRKKEILLLLTEEAAEKIQDINNYSKRKDPVDISL